MARAVIWSDLHELEVVELPELHAKLELPVYRRPQVIWTQEGQEGASPIAKLDVEIMALRLHELRDERGTLWGHCYVQIGLAIPSWLARRMVAMLQELTKSAPRPSETR